MAVRNTGKLIREKSKSENIRLGRLFTKKDTARLMASMIELDKSKTYVVYCGVGYRAYNSALFLKAMGFKVKNMSGGWRAYKMNV